jgi:hypothetical protein
MRSVLDQSLVGLLLILSVAYAMFSLGPGKLRRRLLQALAAALAALPGLPWVHALARRLNAAAAGGAKGSCGGCESCAPAAQPGAATDAAGDPKNEISIPVAKIGRR